MPKRLKLNFKGGGSGIVIGLGIVVLFILIVGGGVAAYLLTRPQKCSKSKFNTDEKCLGGSDSSLSLYKGEYNCSGTKCTRSECCKESLAHMERDDAKKLSKKEYIKKYGKSLSEFYDAINGNSFKNTSPP